VTTSSLVNISFGMIVLNGEPFIRYNLENLYPHAYEILVVEGAVEKFAHAATADGHSLDRTVEIIRNFPDPKNKIRLIQREGFWPEKDEMSNAYMAECTGEYIWQIDVDEFYKPEDIETVRSFLVSDPDITQVNFRTVGFWRSFRARVMGASFIFGADEFIRIFKFKLGFKYSTHRPPTLADEEGRLFEHRKIVTAQELEKMGIVQYHYSYVFPGYVADKSHYYSKMGWGQGHEDGLDWFSDEWRSLSNPLRVHIIKFPPSWLIPFEGVHPEIIYKMLKEIKFEEDSVLTEFLQSDYLKYKAVGEELAAIILKSAGTVITKWQALVKSLQLFIFPRSFRDVRVNASIWQTLFKLTKSECHD